MSNNQTQGASVEAERACLLVKELDRIAMSLAADLVAGAAYSFQGHDYLDREFVMERVVRWRTEWNATSSERAVLLEAARRTPAPAGAGELPPLPEPDHALDCGMQPFYRPDQMQAYARAAIAADRAQLARQGQGFDAWWDNQVKANGGAPIGADYRHWAQKGYLAAPAPAVGGAVARVTKLPGLLDLESLIEDDKWPEGVTDLYVHPATASAQPADLAAAFNAAVDAEYPLPDNPHAYVIQRATDNRAAMWRGINAARNLLAAPHSQPVRGVPGGCNLVAWGNFKDDGTCVALSQHPEDIARWQNPQPLYRYPSSPDPAKHSGCARCGASSADSCNSVGCGYLEGGNGEPAAQPVAPVQGAQVGGQSEVAALQAENERMRALLNSPELRDFAKGVVLEAAHQRERWSTDHDAGKAPADWFWLIGYLGGKALNAHMTDNVEKALHHTISTAAACANWHAAILGKTTMRPGIEPPPEQPHSTAKKGDQA